MNTPMDLPIDAAREFWRGVLAAGGLTTIPRWAQESGPGLSEHAVTLSGELVARLRERATESGAPLSSVLLAAHAKVLAALAGERDVVTGYVASPGGRPVPCRLTTEPDSWRTLVKEAHWVESELLPYQHFPVDDLRRELGLAEAPFEVVFDPTGGSDDLPEDTVLRVSAAEGHDGQLTLRLRYRR